MTIKQKWLMALLMTTLISGCSYDTVVFDADGDGVSDDEDGCPYDPLKTQPGICGCGYIDELNTTSQQVSCRSLGLIDTDRDSVPDIYDECPKNFLLTKKSEKCGCDAEIDGSDKNEVKVCKPYDDRDYDGVVDELDGCPDDPLKITEGECGCGKIDYLNPITNVIDCEPAIDSDADGVPDVFDQCPYNPYKKVMDSCGCDVLLDSTGGCLAILDQCPDNPDKMAPGACGCNASDADVCPFNGIPDCLDLASPTLRLDTLTCMENSTANNSETCPDKIDSDNDGHLDCVDACPFNKDTYRDDEDCDGVIDSKDACPLNPMIKTESEIVSNDEALKCILSKDSSAKNDVFVVSTQDSLHTLRKYLEDKWDNEHPEEGTPAPMPRDDPFSPEKLKASRITIQLTQDINLGDFLAEIQLDSWDEPMNHAWESLPPLFNADIIGANPKSNAPVKITATKNGKRVALDNPLFVALDYVHVANIQLDYDVTGLMAAALANGLFMTSLKDVTFSGVIAKQFINMDIDYQICDEMNNQYPDFGEYCNYYIDAAGGLASYMSSATTNVDFMNYYELKGMDLPVMEIVDTFCDKADLYYVSKENFYEFYNGLAIGCIAGHASGDFLYKFNTEHQNNIRTLYSEGAGGGIIGFLDYGSHLDIENVKSTIHTFYCEGICGGFIGVASGNLSMNSVDQHIKNFSSLSQSGGLIGMLDVDSQLNIENINNRLDEMLCDNYCGGMIGVSYSDISIKKADQNITNFKTVSSSGGLIGSLDYESQMVIDDFHNTLDVFDCKETCGGIVAYSNGKLTLKNVDQQITKYNTSSYAGGLVGYMNGVARLDAENVKNRMDEISCDDHCGGMIGVAGGGDISIKKADQNIKIFETSSYTGGLFGAIELKQNTNIVLDGIKNTIQNFMAQKYPDDPEIAGGLIGSIYNSVSEINPDLENGVFSVKNIFSTMTQFSLDDEVAGQLFGKYDCNVIDTCAFDMTLKNIFTMGYSVSNQSRLMGQLWLVGPLSPAVHNVYYYQYNEHYTIEGVDLPLLEGVIAITPADDQTAIQNIVTQLNADSDNTVTWAAQNVPFKEASSEIYVPAIESLSK